MESTRSSGSERSAVVLAIDQGTTNTKALLVGLGSGRVLSEASAPTGIRFPAPGWVEQDAQEIWLATTAAITACMRGLPGAEVVAVAISNQRETAVTWSRSTGLPLGPALGWQDARTTKWCDTLVRREPSAPTVVRRRTGLSLDAMFSAPKFRAAIVHALRAGADRDDVLIGTVDSWLIWNLTGEHLTEYGNASRTMLLGLESLAWEDELLDLFEVDRRHLPELRASDAGFGRTVNAVGGVRAGVPVVAVLADSHSALYHHGCTTPGSGKATYGTGTSVMTPISDLRPAPHGIATTVAWHAHGKVTYAREGNIVASGSALDWMAATLGGPPGAGGAFLTELAASVTDSGGVSFVPAFSGLGAPHWDRAALGVITGVTRGTTREQLALAALEAVAHQVADVVEAMEVDRTARIDQLHADGGATASRRLMQVQADLLSRPVTVADSPAASALGVARLAAERLGFAPPEPAAGLQIDPVAENRHHARNRWAQALSRSRGVSVSPEDAPPAATTERNS
jgi:glycerol kinase